MEPIRANFLGVALVLAVGGAGGLIVSTALASRALQLHGEQGLKKEQSVQVTGSARKRIRSDLAVWQVEVSGDAPDLKAAFQVLKDGVERVGKFLELRKFKPAEITLSSIVTTIKHRKSRDGNETAEIIGYTLSREFTISTERVDDIALPAADVTELIKEGVSVTSNSPKYLYTKLSELKIEMIGEATKDARGRAEEIASNAGCTISEVRNARMGVMQITQPNSTEVSSSGICDTTTIDKDVTSVVSLTLGLERR